MGEKNLSGPVQRRCLIKNNGVPLLLINAIVIIN
jgi:hypothetical protein